MPRENKQPVWHLCGRRLRIWIPIVLISTPYATAALLIFVVRLGAKDISTWFTWSPRNFRHVGSMVFPACTLPIIRILRIHGSSRRFSKNSQMKSALTHNLVHQIQLQRNPCVHNCSKLRNAGFRVNLEVRFALACNSCSSTAHVGETKAKTKTYESHPSSHLPQQVMLPNQEYRESTRPSLI